MVSGRSLLVWTSALAAMVLTTSAASAQATTAHDPATAHAAAPIRPAYLGNHKTTTPFDECPVPKKTCNTLLVINSDGTVSASSDSNDPFDGPGGDDALVGVLNESN